MNDTQVSLQEEVTEVAVEPDERELPDQKEEKIQVEEKAVEPEVVNEEVDQLDRLIRSETSGAYDLEKEIAKVPVEKPKKEKVDLTGRKHFADWIRILEGDEEKSKEDSFELVERFIEQQPRIAPLKEEEVSKENLARSSAEDLPDELITETLARIHLEQGNRSKSI